MTEPDLGSGGIRRLESGRPVRGTGSLICLLLVAALALAIRLYRIEQQSVWIDEFGTVGCLGVKGLPAQLAFFRFWYSDCTPLDFVLQHFWTVLVGVCPWKLRLLPIFCSMLCVPMTFLLGKAIWGRRVGLLAALFFALSPFHVWYGQTIRPYALVSLLVLLAMYSCLRIATDGGWKWWFFNITAGLLLFWAHPFTLFFVVAEFVFLFWSVRPRRVLLSVWVPFVCTAGVSVLLWLLPTMAYVPSAAEDMDYGMPTLVQIAVNFLGNDAISLSNEFPASQPSLPFLTHSQCGALKGVHPIADAMLCAVYGLVIALSVAFLLKRHVKTANRTECRTDPIPEEGVQLTGVIFLLCVALLPVLQLLLLTLLWRPCFMSRYTLYCSIPLYLLLAAALLRIRRPVYFGTALATVLLLYAYQLSIFVTANTRTDWVSAAAQIKADLRYDDLVLATSFMPFGRELFSINAGDLPVAVEPAYAPQEICERVQQWLARPVTPPAKRPRVWAVVEGDGGDANILSKGFDASLQRLGISHQFWFWPGMTGMQLFLFESPIDSVSATGVFPDFNLPIDYEGFLEQLGPRVAKLDRNSAVDALRRTMYGSIPISLKWFAYLSLMLTEKGNSEFGLAIARSILDKEPSFGFGYFAEATALADLGSQQEACDAFLKAFTLDKTALSVFEPAVQAWFNQRSIGKARNELDKLESIGYPTRPLSAVLSRYREITP